MRTARADRTERPRAGTRPGRALGVLAALLLTGGRLGGASTPVDVTAVATADTTDYRVGDPIAVTVRIAHPGDAAVEAVPPDSGGGIAWLGGGGIEAASDTTSIARFTAAGYDTGRIMIPPLRFRVTAPGDSTADEVETAPIEVDLHDVAVDSAADIRDIHPPVSLGYSWREALGPGLMLLGGLLLAALVVAALRRRRRRDVPPEPEPVDPRPPHEIALERLRRIEAERIWQAGEIKRYHSEVTDAVRAYLERRYGLPAPELTTEEILREIRRVRTRGIPEGTLLELRRMLRRADRVKFARYAALPEENESAMREACGVVERTAERVQEGAESAAAGEAGDGVG